MPYTALYVVLFAFVVLAYSVSDADAGVSNPSVTSDGLLYAAVEAADGWWATQGQQPCQPTVYVYDETQPPTRAGRVIARASGPADCDVYFDRRYVRTQRARLRHGGVRFRRLLLQHVCMVSVHERGHNLGLTHEVGGVMGGAIPHRTLGACIAWSAKKVPALS